MRAKKALITGVTGQDGAYLTELLLEKNYIVYGIKRRSSSYNMERIEHITSNPYADNGQFRIFHGDLTDASNTIRIINDVKPDEIYNLGAQSHVKYSFEIPEYSADTDALGALRILEAMRICGIDKTCKFYQASSSELYGKVLEVPQRETTPFYPRSPYAVAKLYAYWITVNYREAYDMFTCNGILFNHESPRRDENFVTRKITTAIAAQSLGNDSILYLGNLDAYRDWGHARDYVEGMWLMLQQDKPDDYVLATGKTHSVREFVEAAYALTEFDFAWRGNGLDEEGYDKQTGRVLIQVNRELFRPSEVDKLIGDPTKAIKTLGWKHRVTFHELVKDMLLSDQKTYKSQHNIS